ncbi:uncharacterized protein LOC105764363 [Gossypium raimondii]|uniref:uncharacterized protein LOC105764363 n=1 Tax=Gossypium raimondii TaxID=29730 RepID=UPI00063AE8E3|nr:uncharacterized protein LOC105764363 [Gossypium raimondii]
MGLKEQVLSKASSLYDFVNHPVEVKVLSLCQSPWEMVMPFSLNNVGATYQRLVNRIFRKHIRSGLEVYVDDMLVKSATMEEHVQNLSKVLVVLRAHNIKLNSEKCAFGVRAGRLLGFMISKRGIKLNPEKISHKLRPYFQAHPVVVMTNQPIKEVLSKVYTSGRVMKWGIEFAEFGIGFTPRTIIKWKILVEFRVECSFKKPVDPAVSSPQEGVDTTDNSKRWLVYVDGFTAKTGSRVGVLLVDPSGNDMRSHRTTHFNEDANQEAIKLNLNLIDEFREATEFKNTTHAQQVTRYYNTKVKNKQFQVGDLILRNIKASFPTSQQRKMAPSWEGS